MQVKVNITDNSQIVKDAVENAIGIALETCGMYAENQAKSVITASIPRNPESWYTPTGRLRNSITHTVKGNTAYVGTNLEYAAYNEFGTGIYADEGKGRKTPWIYVGSDGKRHITRGIKPVHFLKKAVQDHKDDYKRMMETMVGNAVKRVI